MPAVNSEGYEEKGAMDTNKKRGETAENTAMCGQDAVDSTNEAYSNIPTVLSKLQKWGDYTSVGKPVGPSKFIPMKTPLSKAILESWTLPKEPRHRLTVPEMIEEQAQEGRRIGLILDLSNHNCLYTSDIPDALEYLHIQLVAKELPPAAFVRQVASIANEFWSRNPDDYVAIHCAYGFNRTGFVVCCYLIEQLGVSVDAALESFGASRPPGVKHEQFRNELRHRYGNWTTPPLGSRSPSLSKAAGAEAVASISAETAGSAAGLLLTKGATLAVNGLATRLQAAQACLPVQDTIELVIADGLCCVTTAADSLHDYGRVTEAQSAGDGQGLRALGGCTDATPGEDGCQYKSACHAGRQSPGCQARGFATEGLNSNSKGCGKRAEEESGAENAAAAAATTYGAPRLPFLPDPFAGSSNSCVGGGGSAGLRYGRTAGPSLQCLKDLGSPGDEANQSLGCSPSIFRDEGALHLMREVSSRLSRYTSRSCSENSLCDSDVHVGSESLSPSGALCSQGPQDGLRDMAALIASCLDLTTLPPPRDDDGRGKENVQGGGCLGRGGDAMTGPPDAERKGSGSFSFPFNAANLSSSVGLTLSPSNGFGGPAVVDADGVECREEWGTETKRRAAQKPEAQKGREEYVPEHTLLADASSPRSSPGCGVQTVRTCGVGAVGGCYASPVQLARETNGSDTQSVNGNGDEDEGGLRCGFSSREDPLDMFGMSRDLAISPLSPTKEERTKTAGGSGRSPQATTVSFTAASRSPSLASFMNAEASCLDVNQVQRAMAEAETEVEAELEPAVVVQPLMGSIAAVAAAARSSLSICMQSLFGTGVPTTSEIHTARKLGGGLPASLNRATASRSSSFLSRPSAANGEPPNNDLALRTSEEAAAATANDMRALELFRQHSDNDSLGLSDRMIFDSFRACLQEQRNRLSDGRGADGAETVVPESSIAEAESQGMSGRPAVPDRNRPQMKVSVSDIDWPSETEEEQTLAVVSPVVGGLLSHEI